MDSIKLKQQFNWYYLILKINQLWSALGLHKTNLGGIFDMRFHLSAQQPPHGRAQRHPDGGGRVRRPGVSWGSGHHRGVPRRHSGVGSQEYQLVSAEKIIWSCSHHKLISYNDALRIVRTDIIISTYLSTLKIYLPITIFSCDIERITWFAFCQKGKARWILHLVTVKYISRLQDINPPSPCPSVTREYCNWKVNFHFK